MLFRVYIHSNGRNHALRKTPYLPNHPAESGETSVVRHVEKTLTEWWTSSRSRAFTAQNLV